MDRSALIVLLLAVSLAGCLGSPGQAPDDGEDGEDGDQDPELVASLSVDDAQGPVSHDAAFSIDATPSDNVTGWELDFGDGNGSDGAAVPADAAHSYTRTGRFVATLTVTFGGSTERTDQLAIVVRPPPPPPPIQKAWNVSTLAPLPHPSRSEEVPYPGEGPSHAAIAYEAYQAGGNGTMVLGFEVNVSDRYGIVTGILQMPVIQPDPAVPPYAPDYDLFLFAPNGTLMDSSRTNSTVEIVRTLDPAGGDWLLLAASWDRAGVPPQLPVDDPAPARAFFGAS